jgi:hypothetical protein
VTASAFTRRLRPRQFSNTNRPNGVIALENNVDPHPEPIHRHPNGSIDFDRYRTDAVALRQQALQDTSKLRAAFKLVVIVTLTLGAVAVAPSKNDASACQICVSKRATTGKAVATPARSARSTPLEHPLAY